METDHVIKVQSHEQKTHYIPYAIFCKKLQMYTAHMMQKLHNCPLFDGILN